MPRTFTNDAILPRVRAEYVEMPGMSLRLEQLARLCGVDLPTCKLVVDALVDAQFLNARPDGTYTRFTGDSGPRLRSATTRGDSSTVFRHHMPRKAS